MMTVSYPAKPGRSTGALLALTAMTALVSACGSGGHSTAAKPSVAAQQSVAQQACQQVSAVLSDGPDPDADPVGHAEAQILPLQQIHTSDPTIGKAISSLAGAYSTYYAANGTNGPAKQALNSAINRINSLCPDAGATA